MRLGVEYQLFETAHPSRAVAAGVKSAWQAKPSVPKGHSREAEVLSFDDFTIDLAGRSLRDGPGSEIPLTRSDAASVRLQSSIR